jgi:hypothetical protein
MSWRLSPAGFSPSCAGDAAGQGDAADGHLNQAEDAATSQALADHHHATGQGTDALPALHILLGVRL